eukprot:jgi/Chlat1/4204/Chrsp27S04241
MPSMADALKQMTLGEGQAVAARGSETKVSAGLRAKLLAAAAAFFANAAAILQDHAADFTRVTPKFKEQSSVAFELEKLEKENQLVYYQAVARELPQVERKPIVVPLPYDVPVLQHNLFIL